MVFTRRSLWPSFGMPALDISISSSFTYYSTSNYECTIWLVWLTYDQWNILKNEEHQTDKPKEKIPPLVSHLESTSQEPLPSAFDHNNCHCKREGGSFHTVRSRLPLSAQGIDIDCTFDTERNPKLLTLYSPSISPKPRSGFGATQRLVVG